MQARFLHPHALTVQRPLEGGIPIPQEALTQFTASPGAVLVVA